MKTASPDGKRERCLVIKLLCCSYRLLLAPENFSATESRPVSDQIATGRF